MILIEKNFLFIYEDKQGNELQRKVYSFQNIKEARKHASKLQTESMINDLFKIKVKKI